MESFSSRNLALQAEKKILSRMASKSTVTMFLDETSGEVLDELYRISKEHTQDRAASQKVIKNLVKVAVKVSVLFRNGRFSEAELAVAEDFKRKLHQGAMTAVSFHQVAFTFEWAVLGGLLGECRDLLLRLVEKHLSPKSLGRIRHVFDHFADAELLSRLYSPGEPFEPHLERVCQGLNQLMEQGKL
ncbi:tumor necrosis factor alpha-induced protein 8-like protein 2 [Thamnophis elegans]|uniref:tumor necrosis factor alpha-induced protein 8-like protein 2 n=1 Tax=Thamnophis elegans TaxID=35005 RepID=UPI001376EAAF|nr:tumor necrosis factor alpha-induced protein 8-like protein 2 [Thamnophis elegans]